MSTIFQNRLNQLYQYIANNNLDGLYITNLTNIRYWQSAHSTHYE